jgi:predicted adenine nucleotide alpha hydrolase (AANH) superfamily ATPase
MKILIHTCCANCLIYPYEVLKKNGFGVHSYFYNHIHPFTEFKKRLDSLIVYSKMNNINLIVREEYDLIKFIQTVVYREENRCECCYYSRLEATAKLAAKSNFDSFTTTLLYSKHQKHEMIKEICANLSKKYGIEFYYYDFREGWKYGIEKSKDLGLYRQQYCGCIYSEKERYLGKKNRFKIDKK